MELNEAISYERKEAEVFTQTSNALYRDFYQISLNCQERADYHEQLAEWLTELQERREADRWISIKERMPNEEDYHDCYGFPDGVVMWQTDNGDMGFGWYYHSTKCWSDTNDIPIKSGKVIAWKPLPKPYESEAEND